MLTSIQTRVVLLLILLIILAMQVISVYLLQSLESYYYRDLSARLNPTAHVIADLVERHLADPHPDQSHLDEIVWHFAAQPDLDVSVLNNQGVILSASGPWSRLRGDRYTQLDVSLALSGTWSEGIRPDPETGVRYYHVALPVEVNDRVVGVVHVLGSLSKVYSTMADVRTILLTATLLALAIVIIIGSTLARTITRPIRELTVQAAAIAGGDFNRQIEVRSRDEIGRLGETFNYMGRRLKETLGEISREKGQAEAILTHMADGIIALDRDENIIVINPAAADMLGIDPIQALNKRISDLKNTDLHQVPVHTPPSSDNMVTVKGAGDKMLRVYVATVDSDDRISGHVLVLHDVTEQERLEQLRREFVANVSHELRTPLTTIKTYLETLIDGEYRNPNIAPRFLQITLDETDRMVRMVRDILKLSQMDQGQIPWRFEPLDVNELVLTVVEKVGFRLNQRNIDISTSLGKHMPEIHADRDRIEQVLMNLITNAVEFSPENEGKITISTIIESSRVKVVVADNGSGIPADDLPRIFERFYRVDKARSRQHGGTGLGLSIARDIIHAHQGDIGIDSEPGRGTTVWFCLPAIGGDERDQHS